VNEAPNNHGSDSALCPRCGQPGRSVSEVTMKMLVTEPAKARLKSAIGFCFCTAPNCGVAYFQPTSGECVLREELRVVAFQKSADPKRLVCYCFGHTVEAIQSEARATGFSRILGEIKGQCAQGLDQCERTNPQGSCCLGNVQRVIREAASRNGLPSSGSSSSCCH
jgi:hypothetical protein